MGLFFRRKNKELTLLPRLNLFISSCMKLSPKGKDWSTNLRKINYEFTEVELAHLISAVITHCSSSIEDYI